MHALALRLLLGSTSVTALTVAACGGASAPPPTGSDRVSINSDADDLSTHVADKDEPIDVESAGAATGALLGTAPSYALSLVAEVAPPEIDGVPLQATSVALYDGLAVVSYNMAGATQQGAVDVFVIGPDRRPTLTSRATFADTDVNAVESHDGRIYLATATADETFGTPAVLESLALGADGALSLDAHVRVALSSYAATSVGFGGGRVFATSGNTGGVFAVDPATGAIIDQITLDDARWVTAPGDGTVVALQGTPGRVTILAESDLEPLAEHPFDGASVPESKSTVQVVGGKAFIAGGPGGALVLDVATGGLIAHIPAPTGAGFDAGDAVTNAVSVDGDLVFISNGAAGVFMAIASDELTKPFDPEVPPTLQVVGQLAFPDGVTSVNHIAYRDGVLFVATGKGGLKVVRVDSTEPVADPPTGFPYTTTFDDAPGRAGWTMSGAWGFGVADGDRVGRGGAFLDNNPAAVDQYNQTSNQVALLDVPLAVPAEGVSVIRFDYGAAFLHPDDHVELQLADPSTGAWSTKARFDVHHQRTGLTSRTVYLTSYQGQTTRMRFRQSSGKAAGARRFVVDDLRVGALALPRIDWPLDTSFETELDRARWNLEGAWDWHAGDAYEGEVALDVNPTARDLSGADVAQIAELQGFVPVPTTGLPVFGFWYRTDLAHDDDKIDVDLQVEGAPEWHDLVRFTAKRDHAGWTYREVSLAGYAGQSVRVRIVASFPKSAAEARRFTIDGVRFGELVGAALAYPYACDFESLCQSDWITEGMLAVRPDDGVGQGGMVGADPLAGGPSGDGHELRMLGFISIPASGGSVLGFRAKLGFVNPGDKLTVDVQDLSTGQWLTVRTYELAHARDWADYELPLDGFATRSVRVRFRTTYGAGAGERSVAVDDVRVEGHAALRLPFPLDAALDADGAADWFMTGTWQATDHGFDANPDGRDLAGQAAGHDVVMAGYVDVPTTGRPTLFAGLELGLVDPADKVHLELQVAGQGDWTKLRTYSIRHDRDELGWDEHPLGAWAGKAVRVRVRFDFTNASGPRHLVLGGLRFEELTLPERAYPWRSDFDTEAELADWSLWGAWAPMPSEPGRADAGGPGMLDGNPDDVAQNKWGDLHTATLGHTVRIPETGPAWIGFEHRFGAAHKDDRLKLEVQSGDGSGWETLAALSRQHARDGWQALELSLAAFRGETIRLRLSLDLGGSDVVRPIMVDGLWIGEPALETFAAPYERDFGGAAGDAAWSLHGSWGFDGAALSSNPTRRDTAGYQTFHTATLGGVVDLAGVAAPVIVLTHTLALTDNNDRAYLEVLTPDTNVWTGIASLKKADNVASPTARTWSLLAYAGKQVRLRLRVVSTAAAGVRDLSVQGMYVGPQ